MHTRLNNGSMTAIVILTATMTTWTIAMAVMDFPSRWGGYLVLLCWLASAWSGLSLLRWRSHLAVYVLFFSLSAAIAGIPILLIAFSSD